MVPLLPAFVVKEGVLMRWGAFLARCRYRGAGAQGSSMADGRGPRRASPRIRSANGPRSPLTTSGELANMGESAIVGVAVKTVSATEIKNH